MFTTNNYEMTIEEIARLVAKTGENVHIGAVNNEPVVGTSLECASYAFLEGGKHDWDIGISHKTGSEITAVKKIAEGLYLVYAMEETCIDPVGPYPYIVATRVIDFNYKIAPAIPNFLCNVAFATERPEVGKECNIMVVHFHRTYKDFQLMTPIKISSIEEVIPIGETLVWVHTSGGNRFSADFFVEVPKAK